MENLNKAAFLDRDGVINKNYGYHQYRNALSINLKADDSSTCVCDNGISGKINGIPFSKRCAPEPVGDLLRQKNPSEILKIK